MKEGLGREGVTAVMQDLQCLGQPSGEVSSENYQGELPCGGLCALTLLNNLASLPEGKLARGN
jgi:hypothetical protein